MQEKILAFHAKPRLGLKQGQKLPPKHAGAAKNQRLLQPHTYINKTVKLSYCIHAMLEDGFLRETGHLRIQNLLPQGNNPNNQWR